MTMALLTTNTSSNAATSSFTSSIDNTYKVYVFRFYDVNPVTDAALLTFNASTDGGSNYNVTKTSSFYRAIHNEAGSSAALQYMAANDEAQQTAFQDIVESIGNGGDESAVGQVLLFTPSNTTFAKNFLCVTQSYHDSDYAMRGMIGGYFNTTSAIDAVQFKMSSGNLDAVIKMYGVA